MSTAPVLKSCACHSKKTAAELKSPRSQQGIVLVTVLIAMALMTIIATEILAHGNLENRRTSNVIDNDRALQYALGAEELGKRMLTKLFKNTEEKEVHLGQPWAQPMTFPVEGGVLQGEVIDMQTCFNLNSVLDQGAAGGPRGGTPPSGNPSGDRGPGTPAQGGGQSGGQTGAQPGQAGFGQQLPGELAFERLLEQLVPEAEVAPKELAAVTRDWLDPDQEPAGTYGAEDIEYTAYEKPYRTGDTEFGSISELRTVKGFTDEVFEQVKDYLCVLPSGAANININTLPQERAAILYGMFKQADMSAINTLLQNRPEDGWNEDEFKQELTSLNLELDTDTGRTIETTSYYFMLKATASVGRGSVTLRSLLQRSDDNDFKVIGRFYGEQP